MGKYEEGTKNTKKKEKDLPRRGFSRTLAVVHFSEGDKESNMRIPLKVPNTIRRRYVKRSKKFRTGILKINAKTKTIFKKFI